MSGETVYKRSVIATLPVLEQLIFEYGAREGLVQIVDDVHEGGQGKEPNVARHGALYHD